MTDSSPCPRCGSPVGVGARFCSVCGAAVSPSGEVREDQLLARLRQATLGEYDVLRELGRGGMAAVYLAWDRELARYVAIKVLLPELAHQATMSQRFLQEARTAANLDDHPSVVRVYRAKESQGLRYFVMKYVDGCSLDLLLRAAGPLPVDLAAHVIDQVALALQYAHDHGVVHRDVKPGNVLLDRTGGVVVTDFGIAKIAEGDQLTRTGFAIGTPHYMSPEQWRVEPLTPAADQYALGVVAYHVLAGVLPFDGTHYEIQEHHLRSEPPALDARREGVPPALSTVVRRMLGKRVDQRFADLRSVSQALAAISRDPVPVLRERLSRLIPTAIPGTRDAAATGGTGGDAPASFLRPTPYSPGSSLPPVLSPSPSTPWQPAAAPYTPYPGPPPGGRGGAPVPPVTAPAPGVPAATPAAASAGVSDAAIPVPAPAHAAAAELTPTDGGAPAAAAGLARPAAAPPAVYTPSAPAPLDGADAPTTPAPLAPAPAERPAAAAAVEAPLAQPSLAPTLATTLPPSPAPALSATAMFGAPPGGVVDVPTRAPDRSPVERPAAAEPTADAAYPAGAVAEDFRPSHGVGLDAPDRGALPDGGGADAPARPRRRPVGAALAVGGVAVAAAVFAATRGADREPGPTVPDSTAVAAPPTDPQPTPPPPVATGGTVTPALPDTTQPLTPAGAVAPPPVPVVDPTPPPPPPPPTAAALAEARVAASVVIVGQRSNARLTLAQGDSMLLVSRVFNAAGARLRQADVQWSSSDPARAVRRNGWLVGLAAGGPPVTVTATSGRASNSVQVAVTPRAPGSNAQSGGQSSATIPPPTDAEVRAAADEFLATLRARNFDELSRRLTARAGDGTPTSEFLDWVRSARNFGVREGRPGGVGGDGSVRSFAIGVELRHGRGGLFRSSGYADAVFNIGLRHGAGGWRASSVQLARRVAP